LTEDIFMPMAERRIVSATLNDHDVLPQITKYISEQVASGLGFGLDFSKANMQTLGLQKLSSPMGNKLKLEILEAGQTHEMELSFGLTGHDTTKQWFSSLADRKIGKDQFISAFRSSDYLCEPLRKFSSTDRIFADLYPMAIKVVIKLTAGFDEDADIAGLEKLMIEETEKEAAQRDVARQQKEEDDSKLTAVEKERKKKERIKNLMAEHGYNKTDAERYLKRFEDQPASTGNKREELDVEFKIQKKYYQKYLQYNAKKSLFHEMETVTEKAREYMDRNKQNKTEVDDQIYLSDSIWTFKRKVNQACEELASKVKFGGHLYKSIHLGAGYKLEVEHEGKWHELEDNLTFGDYSHLGLNFKSTTQTCYNVRFTMIDLKAKSGKNKFSVGDAMATTYSDGTTKLEPGAQLCPAPRAVAPWTDPEKLSAMRVEAATGKGVPLDQFGYVKAGKIWVPCMVDSLVPKTNGNSADQEVELILLGPSETVKIKKPLSEVRFVFESNTLLDGEATVLTPEEELIVKESWSKLKDPKRIVDELNKRRAEQNRGGKVTRVSEKAVNAAIAKAKEQLKETLPSK